MVSHAVRDVLLSDAAEHEGEPLVGYPSGCAPTAFAGPERRGMHFSIVPWPATKDMGGVCLARPPPRAHTHARCLTRVTRGVGAPYKPASLSLWGVTLAPPKSSDVFLYQHFGKWTADSDAVQQPALCLDHGPDLSPFRI